MQEANQNQNQANNEELYEDNLELLLLANAKKMDMSFEEVNMFRLSDFIEFTNIYFAEQRVLNEQKNGIRHATQEDIDKFYA